MLIVPVQPVASQVLQFTTPAGQNIGIDIYQMNDHGLFMDVSLEGALILSGVICQQANRIVRDAYFGVIGDFAWFDIASPASPAPPYYSGLGDRWVLAYLDETDLSGAA